jgi:hypothetical protein
MTTSDACGLKVETILAEGGAAAAPRRSPRRRADPRPSLTTLAITRASQPRNRAVRHVEQARDRGQRLAIVAAGDRLARLVRRCSASDSAPDAMASRLRRPKSSTSESGPSPRSSPLILRQLIGERRLKSRLEGRYQARDALAVLAADMYRYSVAGETPRRWAI